MTMKEMLKIHAQIEAEDREHRLWYRNNLTLERLTGTFPIGTVVENFGATASVVGYQTRNLSYTGSLILEEPETGLRWIGSPDFCTAIA